MTALTDTELIAWWQRTSNGWRDLLTQHPEALELPCSVRESQSVAQLLQHMVAVELRYAERLSDLQASEYEAIPYGSVSEIYAAHERAASLLQALGSRDDAFWEEVIDFPTRSAGAVRSTRRAVLVHLCMHSIRHYAQLATLVREHGIKPGWPMDYLFMALVEHS